VTLQNYSTKPLVTVVLSTHDGDVQLAERAVKSVMAQDLPHQELQLLIAYDGKPAVDLGGLDRLVAKADFPVEMIYALEKTGYYTVPRNLAMSAIQGFYVANLDADNEWTSEHLRGLLTAIRTHQDADGWPHFVYSRRKYVDERLATPGRPQVKLPVGPSPLVEWTPEHVSMLLRAPKWNFIDTSDFLIGRSALYELAELTGFVWNSDCRRFGDHELICRMAQRGFRGRAVDQVTHIYNWTGANLQLTRPLSQIEMIPQRAFEMLKSKGLWREN